MTVLESPITVEVTHDGLDRPLEILANEKLFKLQANVNPKLVTLFEKNHFTRRGHLSWALPLSQVAQHRYLSKFLSEYVKTFTPMTLISDEDLSQAGIMFILDHVNDREDNAWGRNYQTLHSIYHGRSTIKRRLERKDPSYTLVDKYSTEIDAYHTDCVLLTKKNELVYGRSNWRQVRFEQSKSFLNKWGALGFVSLLLKGSMLWAYVVPTSELVTPNENDERTEPYISIPRARGMVRTSALDNPLTLKELTHGIETLQEKTYEFDTGLADDDPLYDIINQVESSVTLGYVQNKPAQALLTPPLNSLNPKDIPRRDRKILCADKPSIVTMTQALNLKERNPNVNFIIHPALSDIQNMAKAKPFKGETTAPLFPFQKEAVGLHLATKIGYLQTCSTGVGKTVMQLAAMRERAKTIEYYRGLIVCEANVRTQWKEEAAVWFPEATVHIIQKKKDIEPLIEALSSETPILVILSYAMTMTVYEEILRGREFNANLNRLRLKDRISFLTTYVAPPLNIGRILLQSHWHDICSDESMVIRNGTSKQAQAMWGLRRNSDIATALTATPINKNLDDIAHLLSWVRNDKALFTENLENLYDTTSTKDAKAFFDSFGPMIFRRDLSDVQEEMQKFEKGTSLKNKKIPKVEKPTTILVEPTPAEKALSDAAEHELRRCYEELLVALEEVSNNADAKDQKVIKETREALKEARGSYMGGIQLSRMATSDPAAFESSNAIGTDLLRGQGLIDEALEQMPSKRTLLLKEVTKRVQNGEKIIVFTEFNEVANVIAETLNDNGINAKPFTGKNGTVRDRYRKEFQNGEIDVLVCSKVAYRGITLHKASTLIHYDIPYTQEQIIQRTGRAVRIGSDNKNVDIIFFVMKGTVEERVAHNVVEASVKASLVLDKSRGANLSTTDTGNALKGLISTISKTSDNKNLKEFGAMLLGDTVNA